MKYIQDWINFENTRHTKIHKKVPDIPPIDMHEKLEIFPSDTTPLPQIFTTRLRDSSTSLKWAQGDAGDGKVSIGMRLP